MLCNFLGGLLYRLISSILIVAIAATSSIPIVRRLPKATSAYLGMMEQLGLLAPDSISPVGVRSPVSESLPEEVVDVMPSIGPDGEPIGFLLNANAFQVAEEDFAPPIVMNPISISRVQSAYAASNAVSNTLIITFTVLNNQAPTVMPDILITDTVTDTIKAVSAIDFSQDPNVIHNVLLSDDLLPDNTKFLSADPMPDRDGDALVWNLGDVPPLSSITATLRLQIPTSILTFTDLDTGAQVWGILQGRAISATSAPMHLVPNGFEQWLVWTVDADYYDEYMVQKAAELDNEWQAMFEYVRSLGYESYKGSLRGTRGTLWSEAGNSLDQASLLIAMLRGSGIPARYRHGTLVTETAQSLILSMFPEPDGVIGHIPAGTEVAAPTNDPQLLEETLDHWWVEAYVLGMGWIDLDPCFANAQPGNVFYETLSDDGTNQIAEVPDALRHKVTMMVKVEHYYPLYTSQNKLAYSYPLSHTFNTVELVGEPVTLGHVVNSDQTGGAVFWRVDHTYVPYFAVGDFERVINGNIFQEMLSNFPFGTFVATGEWLIFDVKGVDGNIQHYEREIVDRVGFENRQTTSVLNVGEDIGTEPLLDDFTLFTVDIESSFVPNLVKQLDVMKETLLLYRDLAENYSCLVSSDYDADNVEAEAIANEMRHKLRRTSINTMFAIETAFYAKSDAVKQFIDETLLAKSYHNTPQIIIASQQIYSGTFKTTLDLQYIESRVLLAPGQTQDIVLTAKILQGVFMTILEQTHLEQITGNQGVSVGTVFSRAKSENIPLIVVSSDNLNDLTLLDISDETKARITQVVQNNVLVIVPLSAVILGDGTETVGWLEIESDGSTIGVMENGLHGFAEIVQDTISKYPTVSKQLSGLSGALYGIFAWFKGFTTEINWIQALLIQGLTIGLGFDSFNLKASAVDIFVNVAWGAVEDVIAKSVAINGLHQDIFVFWGTVMAVELSAGILAYLALTDPPLFDNYLRLFFTHEADNFDQAFVSSRIAYEPFDYYLGDFSHIISSYSFSVCNIDMNWVSGGQNALEFITLVTPFVTLYDANEVYLSTGSIRAIPYNSATADVFALGTEFAVSVSGMGSTATYAPALSGLAAGTDWLTYTAELTSTAPYTLTLTDAVVTVNDTDIYTGDFTLVVTGTTVITGSGHTAAPNFA
ncbi:MAG: transglutaminase domain-containing protein, partial [Anaerolineae bacterium]|nr:transglutaminase domain-containing protein [Anaerolineae bacterium]